MSYSSTLLKSPVEIIVLHAVFCLHDALKCLLPYTAHEVLVPVSPTTITCRLYQETTIPACIYGVS